MPSFTLQAATLATLPELYALNPDEAENARLLKTFRSRIERGETHLSNTLILRTARGVEGTVFFGSAPHPYVVPDLRTDAPAEAITAFLRTLRRKLLATSERQLVLDSARADVSTEAVLSAGWALDDSQVVYETDLRAFTWLPDPDARPLDAGRPDMQATLGELGRADLALRDGWTLHGLFRGQELVALGAHGASGRPGDVFEASIDMIGVHPAFRGQGLGRRLHAHLLGRAAEHHDWHRGGTGADNHAMRRIFEHSGSVLLGTQRYFRQP